MADPEHQPPLDEAALLIAAIGTGADVEAGLARLDELAGAALAFPDAQTPGGLARVLFVDWAFAGNVDDYGDPRNSFLPDVIDRRLGLPITLSVLMIEVGRRIGVHLHGVGMPGHFLVGVDGEDELRGSVPRRRAAGRGRRGQALRRAPRTERTVLARVPGADEHPGDPAPHVDEPRTHLRRAARRRTPGGSRTCDSPSPSSPIRLASPRRRSSRRWAPPTRPRSCSRPWPTRTEDSAGESLTQRARAYRARAN